jgi:stearoyl-CoA desaturase (delta-9 desaturase)
MIKLDMDKQFKILLVLHHLAVLGLFFIEWQWWWLGVAFAGWILFGKIGGEIGYHRLFAHRSFETSYFKERALLILGTLNCLGSSYGWVGTHRIHHRYSDTPKDPQSPIYNKWYNVWLVNWPPVKFTPKLVKDLLDDPWHVFIHKYYFVMMIAVYAALCLIDIRLAIFLISASAVWTFHTSSLIVDIVCHKWGYRNFDTKDNSRNNTWANILMLGSGLHNNHHANSQSPYYAVKKWEWDLPGLFIKYFLAKK